VWTVDTAGDMRRFATMGVDAITTNRPDVLRQTLGR
jgi:glycerophosphoryl diester phosphodiesterase